MNSWRYAEALLAAGETPRMTMPRELRLVRTSGGPRLAQSPAAEINRVSQPLVIRDGLLLERKADGARVEVGFAGDGTIFLSRHGTPSIPDFDGRFTFPSLSESLSVWLDHGSIEVFSEDGRAYLSALLPLGDGRWCPSKAS